MNTSGQTLVALNIALCLQLFGTVFALIIDQYIGRYNKRIMLISVLLVLTLVIQQQAGAYFDRNVIISGRTAAAVYGYSIRPVIICMFMQLFGRIKWPWLLVAANAAVYSTAFFSDIAFAYNEKNDFLRGPLGFSCHIVSTLLLILLAYRTVRYFRTRPKRQLIFPLLVVVLIISATLTDTYIFQSYNIDILTVASVSSCIFYYIWLHLQFVSEHERDMMAEQRIKIMMSQIQPHFLFNTLTTIQSLCTSDPELAADTIQKFSVYLRRNIDLLNNDTLIPFEKELEYTRVYSHIEMIRFPNVKLSYDIQDKDFELPALVVQAMVENAISHGVRIRKEGLVCVSARRTDGYHEISVRDNGRGFDVDKALNADSTHIGLRNTRERVERICGGTVEITSVPDEGSEIVIRIPM